jgi:hypothetical protein
VLEASSTRYRKIGRANFSEVFAPLFSRPSSNRRLKVDLEGRYSNLRLPSASLLRELLRGSVPVQSNT